MNPPAVWIVWAACALVILWAVWVVIRGRPRRPPPAHRRDRPSGEIVIEADTVEAAVDVLTRIRGRNGE